MFCMNLSVYAGHVTIHCD